MPRNQNSVVLGDLQSQNPALSKPRLLWLNQNCHLGVHTLLYEREAVPWPPRAKKKLWQHKARWNLEINLVINKNQVCLLKNSMMYLCVEIKFFFLLNLQEKKWGIFFESWDFLLLLLLSPPIPFSHHLTGRAMSVRLWGGRGVQGDDFVQTWIKSDIDFRLW